MPSPLPDTTPWWHRRATPPTRIADVLRTLPAILGLAAALTGDPTTAAMWAAVLLGTTLLRLRDVPAGIDLTGCAVLLVAGWAGATDAYARHEYLDLVVHAATGWILTALVLRVSRTPTTTWPAHVIRAAAAGSLLALCWEVLELLAHVRVDSGIYVAYVDTVTDMVATTAGGAVAGVLGGGRAAGGRSTGGPAGTAATAAPGCPTPCATAEPDHPGS